MSALNTARSIIQHALLITSFVFVMMLCVDYLSALAGRLLQRGVTRLGWGQYLLCAFLGATPGCLGGFWVVSMYIQGGVSLGAVVATMIATSGDEAFVLMALVPTTALQLTAWLFLLGAIAGYLTDRLSGSATPAPAVPSAAEASPVDACCGAVPSCTSSPRQVLEQWRSCSWPRSLLSGVLLLLVTALLVGKIGPPPTQWSKALVWVTLLAVMGLASFAVATVPDDFLEERFWRGIALRHAPRLFLWTAGILGFLQILGPRLQLGESLARGQWAVLAVASLVGILPESGPHLVFVKLYADKLVPFSILLASSMVQDGHAMLPLLAHSRWTFLRVKAWNLLAGLLVGGCALWLGY